MNPKNIINFIFELGILKRIKHEGWRIAGINNPESVAEHSLRASQLGFILAKMEKYENPYEVTVMVVFHDIGECRIGDLHKIARMYVEPNEKKAVSDQTKPLENIGECLMKLWEDTDKKKTTAGIIAKDADFLEQAFTAKEYLEQGYQLTKRWIDNIGKNLQTKSAKLLFKKLKRSNSGDWWQRLKKD